MNTTLRNASVLIVLGLWLVACGAGESGDDKDRETVFDPLVQNIDKAKEVEDKVMQQKAQIVQAVKDAEGTADDAEDDGTD